MIGLKHAIRLRTLFPEMKVRVCYLDPGTPRLPELVPGCAEAGVEFLRGLPSEIQHDEQGKPVVEVEDMTSGEKRLLRPTSLCFPAGFVPTRRGASGKCWA